MSDFSLSTPASSIDVLCSSVEVAPVALFPESTSSVASTSVLVLPSSDATSNQSLPTPIPRAADQVLSINLDTKLLTLSEYSTHGEVLNWVSQCSHPRFNGLNHLNFITLGGKRWVDMKVSTSTTLPRNSEGVVDWQSFDRDIFCKSLLAAVSDVSSGLVLDKNLTEKVKAFSVDFDLQKQSVEDRTCFALLTLESEFPFATSTEQAACYALLVKKLPDRWKTLYENCPSITPEILLVVKPATITDFTIGLLQMCRVGRNFFRVAESFGAEITYSAATKCSSVDGTRIQKRGAP